MFEHQRGARHLTLVSELVLHFVLDDIYAKDNGAVVDVGYTAMTHIYVIVDWTVVKIQVFEMPFAQSKTAYP